MSGLAILHTAKNPVQISISKPHILMPPAREKLGERNVVVEEIPIFPGVYLISGPVMMPPLDQRGCCACCNVAWNSDTFEDSAEPLQTGFGRPFDGGKREHEVYRISRLARNSVFGRVPVGSGLASLRSRGKAVLRIFCRVASGTCFAL
jgi:hypothetical protein